MLIRRLLRCIGSVIRDWLSPETPKVTLTMVLRRQIQMAWELNITIGTTGEESVDIDHGEITVTTIVAGESRTVTQVVPKGAVETGPFYGSEGTSGEAAFHWVDDAGNASVDTTLSFTITDTQPPGAPGELGVVLIREIPDDQVPPVSPTL